MQLHERLGRDLLVRERGSRSARSSNRIHGPSSRASGPSLSQTTVDHEALRTASRRRSAPARDRGGPRAPDRDRLVGEITDDVLGHGPLERLLADDIDQRDHGQRPAEVWIERQGRIELAPCGSSTTRTCGGSSTRWSHRSAAASTSRRRWSTRACPTARRVNAIIPPLSLTGPLVTIRKFARKRSRARRPGPARRR